MCRVILVIISFMIISGCDYIHDKRKIYVRDRGQDYVTSELVVPLEVPHHMSQYHSDVFPLPEFIPQHGDIDDISLKPPGFGQTL